MPRRKSKKSLTNAKAKTVVEPPEVPEPDPTLDPNWCAENKYDPSDPIDDRTWEDLFGFEIILQNRYDYDVQAVMKDFINSLNGKHREPCNCQLNEEGKKCMNDRCPNVKDHWMCTDECGEGCQNQSQLIDDDFEKFYVDGLNEIGICILAKHTMRENMLLFEFCGEIKKGQPYKNHQKMYPIEAYTTQELYVDGSKCCSLAYFLNHSITPNAVVQVWKSGQVLRLLVFTLREIQQGEVISIKKPQFSNDLSFQKVKFPEIEPPLYPEFHDCESDSEVDRIAMKKRTEFKENMKPPRKQDKDGDETVKKVIEKCVWKKNKKKCQQERMPGKEKHCIEHSKELKQATIPDVLPKETLNQYPEHETLLRMPDDDDEEETLPEAVQLEHDAATKDKNTSGADNTD